MENLAFNEKGLIPVITQDARTGAVLMQAYMNREALDLTLSSGEMVYFSRSRNCLWKKGETSGQTQQVVSLFSDCDNDCLLARVIQQGGGACHTGAYSCFFNELVNKDEQDNDAQVLFEVAATIKHRKNNPVEGSYTNYLLDKGIDKICKKIGEESAETIIGCKNDDKAEIAYETADLFYHLLVMLEDRGMALHDVMAALRARQKK